MKTIIVTIEVKDKVDAYKLLNRINYEHKVVKVVYDNKTYTFDEDNLPQNFLKTKKELWGEDIIK